MTDWVRRTTAHMAWRGSRGGSLLSEDFAFLAGWEAALTPHTGPVADDPLPAIQCPACGATIRARMSDQSAAEDDEDEGADCGHHSWAGLMVLLDEHWPVDIFPTREDDPTRDAGARIVSLIRWVDRLRAGQFPAGCMNVRFARAARDGGAR